MILHNLSNIFIMSYSSKKAKQDFGNAIAIAGLGMTNNRLARRG
jgi:hypothetical protein